MVGFDAKEETHRLLDGSPVERINPNLTGENDTNTCRFASFSETGTSVSCASEKAGVLSWMTPKLCTLREMDPRNSDSELS